MREHVPLTATSPRSAMADLINAFISAGLAIEYMAELGDRPIPASAPGNRKIDNGTAHRNHNPASGGDLGFQDGRSPAVEILA
jgi:hypothetical protein